MPGKTWIEVGVVSIMLLTFQGCFYNNHLEIGSQVREMVESSGVNRRRYTIIHHPHPMTVIGKVVCDGPCWLLIQQ